MKKLILIAAMLIAGCESKLVSQEYYKAHLNEAKEEVVKCFNSKDENSLNCDNAQKALSDHAEKEQEKKISNNL